MSRSCLTNDFERYVISSYFKAPDSHQDLREGGTRGTSFLGPVK